MKVDGLIVAELKRRNFVCHVGGYFSLPESGEKKNMRKMVSKKPFVSYALKKQNKKTRLFGENVPYHINQLNS